MTIHCRQWLCVLVFSVVVVGIFRKYRMETSKAFTHTTMLLLQALSIYARKAFQKDALIFKLQKKGKAEGEDKSTDVLTSTLIQSGDIKVSSLA